MTSPAPARIEIEYRAAFAADSRDIARFVSIAGGGLYEFLFDDLMPFMTAIDFLSLGIALRDYPISFRNCLVAVDRETGEIVGAANVFPADLIKHEDYAIVPSDRRNHIRSLLELQDAGSMFVNALAVADKCRGMGVGSRLLDWAQARAQTGGYDRLSLHVWSDNTSAVAFYTARGFVALGIAAVASHPRLKHVGGSMLMHRTVPAGAETAHGATQAEDRSR